MWDYLFDPNPNKVHWFNVHTTEMSDLSNYFDREYGDLST